MYVFSRSSRLSGLHAHAALTWAATITEKVQQTTGLEVNLFSRVYGADVGTLVWGSIVPDLQALEAAFDKLSVDDGFQELSDKGFEYFLPGSTADRLSSIVHPTDAAAVTERRPEYISVVETTIANGHLAEGMAVGVEIAQRAQSITGMTTLFTASTTGNYGTVSWATAFAGIAEMERANELINSDPSFVELIDKKAGGVYTSDPTATQQGILRRIV
jgi:hypothetical protein